MSKNSILVKTAERLRVQDKAVLQKTEEFIRTFQLKGSIKTLNDVAKTVLCLDLSCNHLGNQFDKETAIKLSGLKKSIYLTNLHNIEKILELQKPITVADLCVQLNCTDVKELAEEILYKYKLNLDQNDIHPQYIAAAVCVACKSRRIRIDPSEFIRVSRIKPSQWKHFISDFQVILSKVKSQKMQTSTEDITDEALIGNGNDPDDVTTTIQPEESYEEWRERILKEAYATLEARIS